MISSLLISIFIVFGIGSFVSWSLPYSWETESRAVLSLITFLVVLGILITTFPNGPSTVDWW